jgi:hypothetical protein
VRLTVSVCRCGHARPRKFVAMQKCGATQRHAAAMWNHAVAMWSHAAAMQATQARKMDIRAIALSFRRKEREEGEKQGRKDKRERKSEKDKRARRSSNSRALDHFNYCQIDLF